MTQQPLICLVEDDPIMGESLCLRLELEGFAFDWHRNGRAACEAIAWGGYSLVISDICLPDIGGDELFAQLRASGMPLPPFLFVTGFASIAQAVALLKLGAADYIAKPFDIDRLVEKVRALTGSRRAAAPQSLRR